MFNLSLYLGAPLQDYDAAYDSMQTSLPTIAPERLEGEAGYLDRHVPNILHKVVTRREAVDSPGDVSPWSECAGRYGYQPRLWAVEEEALCAEGAVQKAVHDLFQTGYGSAAAILLAYPRLADEGGIFTWMIPCQHRRGFLRSPASLPLTQRVI